MADSHARYQVRSQALAAATCAPGFFAWALLKMPREHGCDLSGVEIAHEQSAPLLGVGSMELFEGLGGSGEPVQVRRLGHANLPSRLRVPRVGLGIVLRGSQRRQEPVDVNHRLLVTVPARVGDRQALGKLVDQPVSTGA